MAVEFRYVIEADRARPGGSMLIAGHDLILTDNSAKVGTYIVGEKFVRLDTNPTDPISGLPLVAKADQNIYIDARFIWEDFNLNWNGANWLTLPGATRPCYVTNVYGRAWFQSFNMNGATGFEFDGTFSASKRTGHIDYRGHSGVSRILGMKGSYGLYCRNENLNNQGIKCLFDRYGAQCYGISDIKVRGVEFLGGVASIQIKADFLNDDGYFNHPSFPVDYGGAGARSGQTYVDRPGSTVDWTTSTTYDPGDFINNPAVNRIYSVPETFTSSGSIATDISNGDLVELEKRSGTAFNIEITECYFHDCIDGEHGYVGHTGATTADHHSNHIRVSENIITRSGREGFQMVRCIPNMDKYAIDTDDDISGWKSGFFNNTVKITAMGWLRENPNGAANNQDTLLSLGMRGNGFKGDNNILMGGAEFGILCQQDQNFTGHPVDAMDENTWSSFSNNYFATMGGHFHIYCQSSLTGDDRYFKIKGNYFADSTYIFGQWYGDSEVNYIIGGNDTDSFITISDNIRQDGSKAMTGFSPSSDRITESNNTVDAAMPVPQFVRAGSDDWTRVYHWTAQLGRKAGEGGGVQPGSFYNILADDIVVNGTFDFFKAKSNHQSDTADSEPGVGADWETYWEKLPEDYFPDDLRLVPGDPYKALGMGVGPQFDTETTSNPVYSGNINNIILE